jgi:hypothetical protein
MSALARCGNGPILNMTQRVNVYTFIVSVRLPLSPR